ncbi:MAG: ATP-binding protein [Methanomicrobiales archaeon]|nr:ATP-binding protein [Methanomicrobiales archaeon]
MMNLENIDPQDRSKFRLIGTSVLLYRFIVPHDAQLFVGDILKVVDAGKGYTFFAKVTDLFHESNFTDNRWDTRPYSDHFYGLGEDVFLGVEAVPLGYVDSTGGFRKPRTIPTKFSPVQEPGTEDFAFLMQVMGDIEVGAMKTGQDVLQGVEVSIPSSILPQHMGVFATTGMGKSNFMKVFSASSMKARKFGLLVVDPHGEYLKGGPSTRSGLIHYQTGREGLAVYSIREEKERKKYGLNRLWLEFDDFRMNDLGILYEISGPQSEIIEALGDFRGSEVIHFFQQVEPETFDANSYRTLEGKNREIAYRIRTSLSGPLRALKRKVDNLVHGNREFFREGVSSFPEILRNLHENRVVLIDIPRMGERSELFILSMITRMIMEQHQEKAKQFGIEEREMSFPQVLIAIEEAQRVLGAGREGTQIFRECAMEGRKFGVGLCVITQQPKNIDFRVLAQINTFIVMGLGDKHDRDIIASSAKQDLSRMDTEIQTLDRGEAIISTIGIPFPVSTRIHHFDDYIRTLNQENKRLLSEGLEDTF